MDFDNYGIKTYASEDERDARDRLAKHFKACPIPEDQLLSNLGLFVSSKSMARILFMNHIYSKIVDHMGVVMEFGTRWGQNAAIFSALRGIYEPFNRHRKVIAFDTFTGFPKIDPKDGRSNMMKKGHLAVTDGYREYLEDVLSYQEQDNPLSHIKKFEICQGDASVELAKYFERNPETIVSLAYFDFDVYEPTKVCLELIKPRLTKGSVLGFDELNDPDSPGETQAVMEVFGLNNIALKRLPFASRTSYFIVE